MHEKVGLGPGARGDWGPILKKVYKLAQRCALRAQRASPAHTGLCALVRALAPRCGHPLSQM